MVEFIALGVIIMAFLQALGIVFGVVAGLVAILLLWQVWNGLKYLFRIR